LETQVNLLSRAMSKVAKVESSKGQTDREKTRSISRSEDEDSTRESKESRNLSETLFVAVIAQESEAPGYSLNQFRGFSTAPPPYGFLWQDNSAFSNYVNIRQLKILGSWRVTAIYRARTRNVSSSRINEDLNGHHLEPGNPVEINTEWPHLNRRKQPIEHSEQPFNQVAL
ncbi:unnamed protein product, partial [Porites lobata]